MCRAAEAMKKQLTSMARNSMTREAESDDHAVAGETFSSTNAAPVSHVHQVQTVTTKTKGSRDSRGRMADRECRYCRLRPESGKCPAFGITCHNCGKRNHFVRVCRQSAPTQSRQAKPHRKGNIYAVQEEELRSCDEVNHGEKGEVFT